MPMPAPTPTREHRWLDPTRIDPSGRSSLREQWQLDENDRVAALLADSTTAMDAAKALVAVGLAAETGRPWRLLLHPQAAGVDRAVRIAEAMGRAERLLFDQRLLEPWSILPGCDAAVVVAEPCKVALTWAMAAKVPIVAERSETVDRYLTHEQTALLGQPGLMRKLSWGLCRLHDDRALVEQLTANAAENL
jgi:hypothetical protein